MAMRSAAAVAAFEAEDGAAKAARVMMFTHRNEEALAGGELVWFRALGALTTTLLGGTDYVEESPAATLVTPAGMEHGPLALARSL